MTNNTTKIRFRFGLVIVLSLITISIYFLFVSNTFSYKDDDSSIGVSNYISKGSISDEDLRSVKGYVQGIGISNFFSKTNKVDISLEGYTLYNLKNMKYLVDVDLYEYLRNKVDKCTELKSYYNTLDSYLIYSKDKKNQISELIRLYDSSIERMESELEKQNDVLVDDINTYTSEDFSDKVDSYVSDKQIYVKYTTQRNVLLALENKLDIAIKVIENKMQYISDNWELLIKDVNCQNYCK